MAQVKDPVCDMTIDSERAAATSTYEGQRYYFCSDQCKRQFDANPAAYAATASGARRPSEQRPETR